MVTASQVSNGTEAITAQRAAELATAAVRTFGSYRRPYLEKSFGGRIDFQSLQADRRIFLADSPLDQTVAGLVHPAFRKHIGPFFLVVMRDGTKQVLSVAVSAYDTDIGTRSDTIVFPTLHGDDFLIDAVSQSAQFERPISPEQAIWIAARALGTRVVTVPDLRLGDPQYAPQLARWHLELEQPVVVRGTHSGKQYTTSEIYVDSRGALSVPAPNQIAVTVVYEPTSGRALSIPRREGWPLAFEEVVH
jgi:hypothetical protein